MNPQSFSIIGYVSVALWLFMIGLWVLQEVRRPRGWFSHIALVVGICAFILAKINSETHVNRLEIDRSEQIAEQQARQEAARKAAIEARGDEVAQVRFAEDGRDDFLDKAGMDDADREYFKQQLGEGKEDGDDAGEPAWKREKKERSSAPQEDDSLEGMLDTTEEEGGMDTDEVPVESDQVEPSAILPDADVAKAHMLDGLNLKIIRWLLLLNIGVIAYDYVRRANSYEEAYYPLPLPGSWVGALTPLESAWPVGQNRTVKEDLEWIVRRGDSFLYITDDSDVRAILEDDYFRWPFSIGKVDILHADIHDDLITDELIFESLWYGRASFVMDSNDRADAFIRYAAKRLANRRETRAGITQPMHIIWGLSGGFPEELREEMELLCSLTGVGIIEKIGSSG